MTENEERLNKYGKPLTFDRNFRGPLERNRSCTDVPCLLIFLLFLGGWGFIAHYAITHGDLNKLMVPTDSFNRKCGIDSQVLDKKYLFFFSLEKCIDPFVPITGCPTPQVCVKSCPTQTFFWDKMKDSLSFEEIKERLICLTDEDKNNIRNKNDVEQAIREERCARLYIKSAPFLNRCIWEFAPQVCEYIPSILLNRNKRQISYLTKDDNKNNTDLQHQTFDANALITQEIETEMHFQALALTADNRNIKVQSKLELNEEPLVHCRRNTELKQTVIKDKMRQTDTRLAKLVGNLIAHFYNGTHDTQQIGEEIVEDMINSSYLVLIALCCTLISSLIFIALMRWLAAYMLWFSILGVILGLGVGVFFSIRQYTFWNSNPTVPHHSYNLNSAVKNILQEQNTWLYLSIALIVILIIILLLVIVLRKRINIAIALIKEGSKAVSSVISTVFFPIFSYVLFIVVIVYALAIGLYLLSIGESSFRMIHLFRTESSIAVPVENCVCDGPAVNYKLGDYCNPQIFEQYCYNPNANGNIFFKQFQRSPCTQTSCSFVEIKNPIMVKWFFVYNVFGFFWLLFFISAFSDMVLAATFATWYWTFKKRNLPFFTLTRAFRQTVFYHLGTLAFGSLILAICRMIRVILEYIDDKLKKYDNAVTRAILCCMKCFFWLLETFLKFLNRNAYIQCAIHGKNFCTSAKDAFNLIMRNFLRVVTLDKVTDFLFFLSKILITVAAGVGTYYFLVSEPSIMQLHHIAVPIAIVVVGAFLITSVFFSVYSMAVDTLFLCFLEDNERNDGTPEKPYFMSKQLMRILGKRNKIPRRNK